MKQEIERKFLLASDAWREEASEGVEYKQAFLISNELRTVRIRIADGKGYVTIKGKTEAGSVARPEYEYEIPFQDASDMIDCLCESGTVVKTRYKVPYENHVWEIDIFHGDNEGLVTAEVEMKTEDEEVILPPWIGQDVSHDHRYANGVLAKVPFKDWK